MEPIATATASAPGGVMREVTTIDYHTAGEPFRIVTSGVPEIPGATVAERRARAPREAAVDEVRRLLCHEPRGHADMYGCFLVPPDDGGADLGVLFWHKDGYSTACGHGTIALGAWAVESGRVAAAPETVIRIDVPSGRVTAVVHCRDGAVESVTFRNVPAYVHARSVPVATRRGVVTVDLAYGGALYACVPAIAFGLAVSPDYYTELIAAGRAVKAALPDHDLYGTILYEDLGDLPTGPYQRNVTVFADGEVDRSPCGSGTSARVALLAADGRLDGARELRHDSLVGTTFVARVAARTRVAGRDAVVSEVDGAAYRTGEHRFTLDPRDPLGTGFVLR
jgi:proline racemase/trans-L-3-hydroxyproline dehydratase